MELVSDWLVDKSNDKMTESLGRNPDSRVPVDSDRSLYESSDDASAGPSYYSCPLPNSGWLTFGGHCYAKDSRLENKLRENYRKKSFWQNCLSGEIKTYMITSNI